MALPENVAVAEILPVLLRHAGEGLADDGLAHGGWVLRRPNGEPLDVTRTLGAQGLRDGEVLHLAPRRDEWPEMDYDDVIDAIARGSRRYSRSWTRDATRRSGLSVAAGALLLVLAVLGGVGPDRVLSGIVALALAPLLVLTGVVFSRVASDTVTGAALGAIAMPYALFGGVEVLNDEAGLLDVGPQQILLGAAALLLVSLIGYLGVADRTQLFVAGMYVGLMLALSGCLGLLDQDRDDVCAVLVALSVALVPAFPLLSIRIGKLPVPALPTSPEDLLEDAPMPSRSRVYASVVRSDELLTGMLLGAGLISAVAQTLLLLSGRTSCIVLVVLAAMATLLRARLFPTVRQRVPLLGAGIAGLSALVLVTTVVSGTLRLAALVPGLLVVAALVVGASLVYSRRAPSPYLGRIADILDVLLVAAVIPVTCGVLGLYALLRGLGG